MSDVTDRVANPPPSSDLPMAESVGALSAGVRKLSSTRRQGGISRCFETADPSARHLGPYCQGRASRLRGDRYDSNPYPRAGRLRYFFDDWNEGWLEADLEQKRFDIIEARPHASDDAGF